MNLTYRNGSLLACRLLTGVGAALIPPNAFALVGDVFPPDARGPANGVVTPLVVLDRAGGSRITATGLFAVSNQLGAFGGASLGGLMLALGGFPLVGRFCLGVAVVAAGLIYLSVRELATFLAQAAPRPGPTAPD